MQPVTLFPLVSGYCVGVLPKLVDISPSVLMTMLALLVGAQVNALNLCFLRKHQAIAKISNKYVLSKNLYNIIVLFFLTYTFSYCGTFYFARYSKEDEWKIIAKVGESVKTLNQDDELQKYSNYQLQFEKLPNFGIYELNGMIVACVMLIIGGCIQSILTVSLLAFQMYQVLIHCRLNLSKTTLEKHKSAVKSLVGQFMTTPIAILPAMLIVSTIFFPFRGAQKFTWYMLMVMTTHSTMNCLVVIFTFPEFRGFVLFWSKEGKLQRHRKSVSFLNNTSNGSTRQIRISTRNSVSQS